MSKMNQDNNTESTKPAIAGNIFFGIDTVPIYEGTENVDDFIEHINTIGLIANWSEEQKLAVAKLKLFSQTIS